MERTALYAETRLQRLLMEKALAMAQELERAGTEAADGHVLEELEQLAMERGRQFTREALQGALQLEVEDVEKKLRSVASAPPVVKSVGTRVPRRGGS
jgi:hypothetical protein